MKTASTCIIISLVVVLIGARQHARIVSLNQQIASAKAQASHPSPSETTMDRTGSKRRSHERAQTTTVPEAYKKVVSELSQQRSTTHGPGVAQMHQDSFRTILQLSLPEQIALMEKLATSKQLSSIFRISATDLCLCAIADEHPQAAIEELRKLGNSYDAWEFGTMMSYFIQRICAKDPRTGLDLLVKEAALQKDGETAIRTTDILLAVAEHDALLALDTIPRLPPQLRKQPLRIMLEKTDTDEESTRRFHRLRMSLRDDPAMMSFAMNTLLENVSKRHNVSLTVAKRWIEGLNLSNEEKLGMTKVIIRLCGEHGINSEAEPTKWLAEYLPPCQERDFIIWRNTTLGMWSQYRPEEAKAFLKQHHIDCEEMERLEQEGYLRMGPE